MNNVRFAFGRRPEIDDLAASDLIGNLGGRRSFEATAVIGEIHAELQKTVEHRSDIALTRPQLEALIAALEEDLPRKPPDSSELPQLKHLLDEARAAHALGDWARASS